MKIYFWLFIFVSSIHGMGEKKKIGERKKAHVDSPLVKNKKRELKLLQKLRAAKHDPYDADTEKEDDEN